MAGADFGTSPPKYEFCWDFGADQDDEDVLQKKWMKMGMASRLNMMNAVAREEPSLMLYDQCGTGRIWVFTEPPSVHQHEWRLKPKHQFSLQMLVREIVSLVVQVEADMACSIGYNIKLTSPLTGNLVKTLHQENPRMSVRHFHQFLCEELAVNDVKMMFNGSYIDVMANARVSIKRLFGFMADQQAL